MRHILHLSGDFAKQRIYTQLVSHLALRGLEQTVYAPVRTAAEAAWRTPELEGIPCHLRFILRPRHRILFRTKIRRIVRDLTQTLDVGSIDLIHAHFLYSDGAVALKLKRAAGIPYIVAVRNADLNAFMRLRPDLAGIRNEVLREAGRVIFLSQSYRSAVLRRLPADLRARVDHNSLVIPNGLRSEWLSGGFTRVPDPFGRLRILYVGDYTANKNLPNVLRAAAILDRSRPVQLTMVGGGGDGEEDVLRLLASGEYPFASNLGRIEDQDRLREIYRMHDVFAMPSFTETFGVAYLEALSQGLPVIYSHGQGIDGYFSPGTVAEAVDPSDPVAIARALRELAGRLPLVQRACISEARKFAWPDIAQLYEQTYGAVMAEQQKPETIGPALHEP